MSKKATTERVRFFGRWQNLFFALLIGIPVWMVANTFTEHWRVPEDESMATAVVIVFLLAVFSGRYLAIIWKDRFAAQQEKAMGVLILLLLIPAVNLFRMLDYSGDHPMGRNLAFLFLSFILFGLASGVLIKIVKNTQQTKLTRALVEADKSQAELKLLQAQLSPHFLFNTLNNLYGLSIAQPEKLPNLLLKLSDLLRYSVYGSSTDKVSLKEEIAYLRHYIEFESIRIGDRLELKADFDQVTDDRTAIAPMLLIVFVENAFKHSRHTSGDKIYIEIRLICMQGELLFLVSNSCASVPPGGSIDKNSGFGLENLEQRLELLYPNQYYLRIHHDGDLFKTELRLKTSQL